MNLILRTIAFQPTRKCYGSNSEQMLAAISWKDFFRVKRKRDGTQVKSDTISEGKYIDMRLILSKENWHTAWTRKQDVSWMQLKQQQQQHQQKPDKI